MSIAQSLVHWCELNNIAYELNEIIGSTNDRAKKNLTFNKPRFIYITQEQSHGRGRGQNQWLTPGKDQSILMSWVYALSSPPQPIASPLIGLSLFRAAMATWPDLTWALKPPNDLQLNAKKVAGILLEAVQQGSDNYLIIGMGFNILQHPEMLTTATHLNSSDGMNGNFNKDNLKTFFDRLDTELSHSLSLLTHQEMPKEICDELCRATGATDISPLGDIKRNNQTLSWKDL